MNFLEDVLEESKNVPVLVDFWAPWCGPCKFLGPVLEELVKEANGKWKLVKVNTDENQDLSSQYGIRGIPAVKLFDNGAIIGEFTGALARHQVERWLDEHLPDERKKQLNEILRILQNDEMEGLRKLGHFVDQNPDLVEARIEMAKRIVFSDLEKATELVQDIKPGHNLFNDAEHINILNKLAMCKNGGVPALSEKILEAQSSLKSKNLDNTLDALIGTVLIDKNYCEELPRKSVIAIFNLLGSDHELTRKYRRKFDMALY